MADSFTEDLREQVEIKRRYRENARKELRNLDKELRARDYRTRRRAEAEVNRYFRNSKTPDTLPRAKARKLLDSAKRGREPRIPPPPTPKAKPQIRFGAKIKNIKLPKPPPSVGKAASQIGRAAGPLLAAWQVIDQGIRVGRGLRDLYGDYREFFSQPSPTPGYDAQGDPPFSGGQETGTSYVPVTLITTGKGASLETVHKIGRTIGPINSVQMGLEYESNLTYGNSSHSIETSGDRRIWMLLHVNESSFYLVREAVNVLLQNAGFGLNATVNTSVKVKLIKFIREDEQPDTGGDPPPQIIYVSPPPPGRPPPVYINITNPPPTVAPPPISPRVKPPPGRDERKAPTPVPPPSPNKPPAPEPPPVQNRAPIPTPNPPPSPEPPPVLVKYPFSSPHPTPKPPPSPEPPPNVRIRYEPTGTAEPKEEKPPYTFFPPLIFPNPTPIEDGSKPGTDLKPEREPDTKQTPTSSCNSGCSGKILKNQGALGDAIANNQANLTNILQGADLTLLTVINDKLGDKIPNGGISGFMKRAWQSTRTQKVLNLLNTALLIHNAAMLSRNLGASVGDAISGMLNNTLDIIKDENDEPIDINETIGNSVEGFLRTILGSQNYDDLTDTFKRYNRIINSAANITAIIQSSINGLAEGIEIVGKYTGKMGNALKKSGAVLENSLDWFGDKFQVRVGPLGKLQRVIDGLESVENVASDLEQVSSEFREISENVNQFEAEKREITEALDAGDQELKELEDTAKSNSQAPGIELVDTVKPTG